ncbi:major intrinsically disordered Notch2-binding receptor 1 isoform X2 [Takifugu flavidus]|uniref:major intrinsically disordered Notch2-binding receptor 1 isoform X2 n=1 Tax=Takifugu flavidus TaxID=433684 RepID=UPI002544210B|nr:major intrinsically disordered Notch2-binding receptor 1 isoform X2 [Takifugu flavidus]
MDNLQQQEYPDVLLGILEELASMRQLLSFQDLCRLVSTRFDLEHLLELRSLLFAAASRDPCFPATLFRDRVSARGQGLSPIGVAADIVTIFNLIQMMGVAYDTIQPTRAQTVLPVDQFPGPPLPGIHQMNIYGPEKTRTHSDSSDRPIDQHLLFPRSNYSVRKRGSLPPDPISLVSSPPIRARAVSFDLPHTTHLYSTGQVLSENMKNIYLPLETDSESSGESVHMDVFETDQASSVNQRRNIFRKDFHNQPPLIPQVTINNESPSPGKGQKAFNHHSFDAIPNPYPSPIMVHQSPEQRTKHESLDDLQDSTYFGPGAIPEWSPQHLKPPKNQKLVWSNKSHSLEDRIGRGTAGFGMESQGGEPPRRSSPAISSVRESCEGESEDSGLPSTGEIFKAQGTQTDPPDPRRLRGLVHADRLSFMTSLDDPDFADDDISAIFRFLDDISMCGSTGVLHATDGIGGVNQDTHEARRGRLGQLQRLFHSLESSDDGLKASVCKLLLRMSQIERQLDSLNDVKSEISQVLSALQRLDEKIQQPISGGGENTTGRWLEPLSGVSSFMSHPLTPSDSSEPQPLSSGRLFPGTSTSSLDWNRWNTPGEKTESSKSQADSKGRKEGKKDASSRRASKTQLEEKIVSDDKQANVSTSARDWTVSFSKSKDEKSSQGQTRQAAQLTLSPKSPPTWWNRCLTHLCSTKKKAKCQVGSSLGRWWTPGWSRGGGGPYGP